MMFGLLVMIGQLQGMNLVANSLAGRPNMPELVNSKNDIRDLARRIDKWVVDLCVILARILLFVCVVEFIILVFCLAVVLMQGNIWSYRLIFVLITTLFGFMLAVARFSDVLRNRDHVSDAPSVLALCLIGFMIVLFGVELASPRTETVILIAVILSLMVSGYAAYFLASWLGDALINVSMVGRYYSEKYGE